MDKEVENSFDDSSDSSSVKKKLEPGSPGSSMISTKNEAVFLKSLIVFK